MPTRSTTLTHDDEAFTIEYKPLLACEDCGHHWPHRSTARRPTCPNCGFKINHRIIGKYYSGYLQATVSAPLPDTPDDIATLLHEQARKYNVMSANGWELTNITTDGHVELQYIAE